MPDIAPDMAQPSAAATKARRNLCVSGIPALRLSIYVQDEAEVPEK
jgi:hypothetical protein